MSKEPILKVKDLGISFSQYTNGLVRGDLNVIRNLDIELYEGEILAVFQLYTSAFSGILKAGMACLHGTGRSPTIRMFQTVMTIEKRSSDHESIYG